MPGKSITVTTGDKSMEVFVTYSEVCIYSGSEKGFTDAELGAIVRKGLEEAQKFKVEGEHNKSSGYVYLFSREIDGAYKIGLSKDPEQRMKQVSKDGGYGVEIVHTIPTDNMEALEWHLHDIFSDKRVGKTEWFNLSPTDVEAICIP